MKIWWVWLLLSLGALLFGLLCLELVLRFGFGFGNPPLYVADDTIGYRLAPNQQVRRFGNRIHINKYSMRAEEIAPSPSPDTFRLFLLGDSLANGNWWTDQDNILSKRIAHYLKPTVLNQPPYKKIEALNASANSWGPRNELAYLERFGTFDATVLVLLLNTDDLFGTAPISLQVGRDRSYPNRPFPLALAEPLSRLRKQQPIPGIKEAQNEEGDRVGKNITAVEGIYRQAIASKSQIILVLSPLKREISGPRDYELIARDRLQSWAKDNQVTYLDLLANFQQHPKPGTLYRDHIHLSPMGNEYVSQQIADAIGQSASTHKQD